MYKSKVVIFGVGKGGHNALEDIQHRLPQYEVIAFCDNDPKKQGQTYRNIAIESPTALATLNPDIVVIASSYAVEIWQQLWDMDFAMDKVEVIDAHILSRQ